MAEVKEIIVEIIKKGDKFLLLHRQPGKEFDPDRWEFVSAFVKDNPNLQEYAAK